MAKAATTRRDRAVTNAHDVQVEEVVTALAPACEDGGAIFEISFGVTLPGKGTDVQQRL